MKNFIGNRYHVYEIFTKNHFPLTLDGHTDAAKIQRVLWAPKRTLSKTLTHQALAFVYENDIFYKPLIQSVLVCNITKTGKNIYFSNLNCKIRCGVQDLFKFSRYF